MRKSKTVDCHKNILLKERWSKVPVARISHIIVGYPAQEFMVISHAHNTATESDWWVAATIIASVVM